MKTEILKFYRQLRNSNIRVTQARQMTADKFGISVMLVIAIVTGINY